jgi:undecaprenyl-diphosphatase
MAMLLGLIQGATVFMPISYSGHQAIMQNLFHVTLPEKGIGVFDLLMNFGAILSILMAYRRELVTMLQEGREFLKGNVPENPISEGRLSPPIRMIYFIIIGTLPLILAVPISSRIDLLLENTVFVGAVMLAMGFILFATDRYIKVGKRNEKSMSVKDALIIGIGQAFSVIRSLPGGHRACVGLSRAWEGFGRPIAFSCPCRPARVDPFLVFFAFTTGIDWTSFFSYLLGFVVPFDRYLSIQIFAADSQRRLAEFSYYLWLARVNHDLLSLAL